MNPRPLNALRLATARIALASLFIFVSLPVPAKPTATVENPSRLRRDAVEPAKAGPSAANKLRINEAYGNVPMSFERNQGQAEKTVKYLARGPGYTLLLTQEEAALALYGSEAASNSKARPSRPDLSSVVRMKLMGSNPKPKIEGLEALPGKSNYLIGNDQSRWHTDIPNFAKVRYENVYPGIDVVYYGKQKQLEYDFVVAPGADAGKIRMTFAGAKQLRIDAEGNLVIQTDGSEVIQKTPLAYQETEEGRRLIASRCILKGEDEVGFEVAAYDRAKPLFIDPLLAYSTFYGGASTDIGLGIAVDLNGNIYITGVTKSTDLILKSAAQGSLSGGTDAFVTKFDPNGVVVYSTYIGGRLNDRANAIAVTSDGKACITGGTNLLQDAPPGDNNFPITSNRVQDAGNTERRFEDAFVTVLSPNGSSLFYSTYFGATSSFLGDVGGSDEGFGIAVDSSNNIYITGSTSGASNLPTKNAFQSNRPSIGAFEDIFIAKFDPAASGGLFDSTLLYSSYLGGTGSDDVGVAIAVDSVGNAYIAGETNSTDLPVRSPGGPPLQSFFSGGDHDGFVAKFDPTNATGNASLVYLTYFGGNANDFVSAIAVDSAQRAYVTGFTRSINGFPLKNAIDTAVQDGDAFVAKLNANGSTLFYSTFLGGSGTDQGMGIAIDTAGNAYITGLTQTPGSFPTVNGFPASISPGPTFITKLEASDATGTNTPTILYSDTFGSANSASKAITVDPAGNVYVTGQAFAGFPTTPEAAQGVNRGGADAFVVKLESTFPDSIGVFRPSTSQFFLRNSNTTGLPDITVAFGQAGDQPLVGDWNGDGIDDVGVFRPSTRQFLLRQPTIQLVKPCPACPLVKLPVITTITITFGQAGDLAIVGDWDGDGIDTPGVFRAGTFFLTNSIANNSAPPADIVFNFGTTGDLPVTGDWNGDGIDTIGVFRPGGAGTFFLANSFANVADIVFNFGTNGDLPVAGDWTGKGVDGVGVFRPSTNTMFLANNFANVADIVFNFGLAGDFPIAGDWNGRPDPATPPNSGVNNPSSGTVRAGQARAFTTTCSDPDGWHDIATIDFKIAKSDGNGTGVPLALWVTFDENTNLISFYDPDTQTWTKGEPGSNVVLSSRFADLHLAQTGVVGSGPTGKSVQVTWTIVFKNAAVMNNYKQYLAITDDAGFSTGFDKVGSWSVTR